MSAILIVALGRLILAFIAIVAAAGIAMQGRDGWGWFLFIALLLGGFSIGETIQDKRP